MAWDARWGLKRLSATAVLIAVLLGLNGLGCPLGIETGEPFLVVPPPPEG